MVINSVQFVGSFPRVTICPKDGKPEFAFIGRSNVGKSSLINMLCQRKEIAKVSGTPGKTNMINYFAINEKWYLVDLPGYGYAKVSKKARASYEKMIQNYLVLRDTLMCAVVLLDSRHPLQQIDKEFVDWLGQMHIPFVIAYTKIDKVKPNKKEENIQVIREELLKTWHNLPDEFVTSSRDKSGRDELLQFIDQIIQSAS